MQDAAQVERLARRIPILRLSVFWGMVLIALATGGAVPYIGWWWSLGLLAVLAVVLSCLETRDQVRRLSPGKVSPLLEGAKVFIWVVVSLLAGLFAVALLVGWALSLMT
jgi:hypothetical protein